ncbi:MAG: hypothetical protein QM709_03080 [Spongiibacteraceae bacterium]
MSKPSKSQPSDQLVKASYNAGYASGRLEATEESMDAVAALIFKAETLQARRASGDDSALQENARHTLQALHLAFAAVTGSVNGSAGFHDLLAQSRQRLITH